MKINTSSNSVDGLLTISDLLPGQAGKKQVSVLHLCNLSNASSFMFVEYEPKIYNVE